MHEEEVVARGDLDFRDARARGEEELRILAVGLVAMQPVKKYCSTLKSLK